ncbi:MAG: DUF4430 domain-containing protein [Clostridiales bacterium]|nr:DUF4430 domain-containing protein [Clostridiales bacterium]
MKNKALKIFITLVLAAAVLVCGAAFPSARDGGDPGAVASDIAGFKLAQTGAASVQAWLDGDLASNAGTTSEWYVMALRQSGGSYDFSAYAAALERYLGNAKTPSAATRQRYALALIASGRKDSPFAVSALAETANEQGIMSRIFALHLINNGCTAPGYDTNDAVSDILSARFADGGWALSGTASDVDVTAMAVAALAPYYASDANVKSALDGALALLSARQGESGGFSSYGRENPESAAQVIIALASLGTDCRTDSRFIKNGKSVLDAMLEYRLSDGSFSHEKGGVYNHTATFQAFCSLVALWRVTEGCGSFYVFDSLSADACAIAVSDAAENTTQSGVTAPESEETTVYNAAPQWQSETAEAKTDTDTDAPVQYPASGESKNFAGYKPRACAAIALFAAAVCVLLFVTGKKNPKNFIFVLVLALLASGFVLLTDFQSADEYYSGVPEEKTDVVGSVTLSIRCDTLVGRSDSEYIPSDGVVLAPTSFEIASGETVYDILVQAARQYNIQTQTAAGGGYISAINYLYEMQFGELSGWLYHVNGEAQSVGSSSCVLSDGDVIEWLYSCDMGNDLK